MGKVNKDIKDWSYEKMIRLKNEMLLVSVFVRAIRLQTYYLKIPLGQELLLFNVKQVVSMFDTFSENRKIKWKRNFFIRLQTYYLKVPLGQELFYLMLNK